MADNVLFYNRFVLEIDYPAINQDFTILKFYVKDKNENWLSYAEVAKLDNLLVNPECKAQAVVFLGGKEAFVLYKKQEFKLQTVTLLSKLQLKETIAVETVQPWTIKEHKLFQLFLNTCANSDHPRFGYSNLTGGLFITLPEKDFYNRSDQSRIALEVKVKYGNIIDLATKTFTSIQRYKDLIKNEKKEECQKRKKSFLEKPIYEFISTHSSFRRHFGERWEKGKELYVAMRPVKELRKGKKKNEINFLSINPKDYPQTKIAIFNELLFETFLPRLSQYIKLSQEKISESKSLPQNKPRKAPFEKLREIPIYLIDNVGDKKQTTKIKKIIKEEFDLNLRSAKKINPNGINLQFNHNKEAYRSGEDPYQKSSFQKTIQNFTSKEFKANGKNQLYKTLIEAHIKWDIRQEQLSIFNWPQLKHYKDWYFATTEKQKDKEQVFHFLQISLDGALHFSTLTRDLFNQKAHDELAAAFSGYGPKWKQSNIEGLILDDRGQINIIEKTDLRAFPDLERLHSVEMPAYQLEGVLMEKAEMLSFTEEFILLNGSNKRIEAAIKFLEQQTNETIELATFQKVFKGKDNSSLTLQYVDAFYEEYQYYLKSRLRNKESVALNFASLVDLHAVEEDDSLLFWGNRRMGATGGKFPKGNVIRRLVPWNDSQLIFDRLLETMNVDFVRIEGPTVTPFPFKLLREYQDMEGKPDEGLVLGNFRFNIY